jgi:hypothetical protein
VCTSAWRPPVRGPTGRPGARDVRHAVAGVVWSLPVALAADATPATQRREADAADRRRVVVGAGGFSRRSVARLSPARARQDCPRRLTTYWPCYFFKDFSSHRILRHIHRTLNIVKNKNNKSQDKIF